MSSPARTPASSHSRQNSSARRHGPKRLSTSGPLEGDDPLSSAAAAQDRSRSGSTRPLDAASSSSSRQPSKSPAPPAVVDRSLKNLGFLLRPEIYHQLDEATDLLKPDLNENLQSLITNGRFRAAALAAADQLKRADPTNPESIFQLLFVRLACLQILGFHYEAAQEAKSLGDLHSAFYREPDTGKHIAPWALRLLTVRLQALAFGDWRRGVAGYYELAREARYFARRDSDQTLWTTRLQELGLRVGMALVEMGDLEGAAHHLQTLTVSDDARPKLKAQIAMVFLRIGDVPAARTILQTLDSEANAPSALMLEALCEMNSTEYDAAIVAWEQLRPLAGPENGLATLTLQNLAVCQVYAGNIIEARRLLHELADDGETSHGVLFNLSTLLELTSEKARDLKLTLSQKAAAQPPTSIGWERANVDFKL